MQLISQQQEVIKDLVDKSVDTVSENTVHEDSDSGVVFSEAEVTQQRINRSVSGVIKYMGWEGRNLKTRDMTGYQRSLKSLKSENKSKQNISNLCPKLSPNDPVFICQDQRTTPSDPKTSPSEPSKRVFLNHRSVTRLKDIKYKRISKTKSKSMEELREKLRLVIRI